MKTNAADTMRQPCSGEYKSPVVKTSCPQTKTGLCPDCYGIHAIDPATGTMNYHTVLIIDC